MLYLCFSQGLITWARGQQPNLVKALRQENSEGQRDWSGQILSSSSPMYVLIILKDCRHRRGKRDNLTVGSQPKYFRFWFNSSSVFVTSWCLFLFLTLESLGWSAWDLSAQGTDTVAFTQLDVDVSQIVLAGQQCIWSSQHSAYRDDSSGNTLTTKVFTLLSQQLNEAQAFIWLIK